MRPDGARQTFAQAVENAASGIAQGFWRERNVKIDCCFAAAALVLGFAFRIPTHSWLALVVCIGMVLGFELVNTALEAVTDLASPALHPLAKCAKDCAAGACLVASLCAFAVGMIIFLPCIFDLIS